MMLQHNSLTIRSATEKDIDTLCAWWADGAIMAHAGFPNGITTDKEKLKAQIQHQTTEQNLKQLLIIEEKDIPLGEMSYTLKGNVATMGIKICRQETQNQGRGKIYLQMLIDYLFNKKNVATIQVDTMIENKRAQHVYESLGFQKVRIHEDCWIDQRGRKRTAIEYELRKSI